MVEGSSAADSGPSIVFIGPCLAGLSVTQQRRLLRGFEVRPPVARGDVLGALCDRPRALVLLDGYYYTRPAVPHKELLYALDAGVPVFGGASMGALRAAELEAFGMRGVGDIFADYRRGVIDGDDEVALLHSSADDGYRALTVASIEVRYALRRLQRRGVVTAPQATALVDALRQESFDRRTPELLHSLAEEHLTPDAAHRLHGMLRRSSCKRRDAILTLAAARRRPSSGDGSSFPKPSEGDPTAPASTLYFDYFRLWGLSLPPSRSLSDMTLHRAAYLALALHPESPHWVRSWRRRFALARWARAQGLTVSRREVLAAAERLHRDHAAACAVLPEPEVEYEAQQRLLAERARKLLLETLPTVPSAPGEAASKSAPEAALDDALAAAFADDGLPNPLDDLAGRQLQRILPPWDLVRSFVFEPWLPAAKALAARVFPLARRFAQWSEGSKVGRGPLERAACRLWQCSPQAVEAEGLRRGLVLGDGFAEGLWEILEAFVVAERLRPPLEGYVEARQALVNTVMTAAGPRP